MGLEGIVSKRLAVSIVPRSPSSFVLLTFVAVCVAVRLKPHPPF